MSTHNICFHREIRKLITRYLLLSRPMEPEPNHNAKNSVKYSYQCKKHLHQMQHQAPNNQEYPTNPPYLDKIIFSLNGQCKLRLLL